MKRRLEEKKELYDLWRKKVYQRDNFKCQKCGTKKDLEAHHIQNFGEHVELRYVVSNGLTLCYICHEKFHKLFGNTNNTIAQIEKYIGRKIDRMERLF